MDATFSNNRKRLLPALLAILMGAALPEGLLAADTGSDSARSARGTVVFVTPSKPAHSVKSSSQVPSSHQTEMSAAAASKPQTANHKPESAQGDLVLVPRNQVQPSFHRSNTDSPQSDSNKEAGAQQVVQTSTVETGKTRRLVDAMRNRKTIHKGTHQSSQAASEERVQVAQHQEEVDLPGPIAKSLIEAHTLSLRASSEADYSQIIEQCTEALGQGAQKEEKKFARQLTSWSLNRRGQLRVDEGQQELADADFQGALDNNPNNWRALHNRGVSLAQQGFFAEAFDDFNRVAQLNPKYAKAFVNRATLFMQANDLESALEDYRTAARIDPEFSKAQLGIGRVQHMLGQWDEAIEFFDVAVQFDPSNAETLCSRGDLLADMGQYGKALADYARAIEADPEFAHAYRNGSWLLATCPDAQFRDPENALLGARQALEFDYGQRHVALDTLAAALASTGQFDEAIGTLQNAIALAPATSKPAYHQRLQLYQQQQPFRTEPAGEVSQAMFEVTDRQ